MQMVATLTRPSSGRIVFDGVDVVRDPEAVRRRLGYLRQDFGVYDNLTAFELLDSVGRLEGIRGRERVVAMLELVNLHTVAGRLVRFRNLLSGLSGRRLVILASGEFERLRERLTVSSLVRRADGVRLRVVAAERRPGVAVTRESGEARPLILDELPPRAKCLE
jgi:ABC-type uncharacterized transport system ATPase subunit